MKTLLIIAAFLIAGCTTIKDAKEELKKDVKDRIIKEVEQL